MKNTHPNSKIETATLLLKDNVYTYIYLFLYHSAIKYPIPIPPNALSIPTLTTL